MVFVRAFCSISSSSRRIFQNKCPVAAAFVCRRTEGTDSSSTSTTSTDHSTEEEYEDNIKKKILTASLPFVIQYGWSKEAIGAGAESIGYSSAAKGLFNNSGISLVYHFHEASNDKLNSHLAARKSEAAIHSDDLLEIQHALEKRLGMLVPYLPCWPQAIALMAAPQYAPSSLKLLLNLSDDICHHVGDRDVDMTWYTRRMTVAGLYLAGELSLVQDSSPDQAETWAFLGRRIEEVREARKCGEQVAGSGEAASQVASAAATTLKNILGFNSYSRK